MCFRILTLVWYVLDFSNGLEWWLIHLLWTVTKCLLTCNLQHRCLLAAFRSTTPTSQPFFCDEEVTSMLGEDNLAAGFAFGNHTGEVCWWVFSATLCSTLSLLHRCLLICQQSEITGPEWYYFVPAIFTPPGAFVDLIGRLKWFWSN